MAAEHKKQNTKQPYGVKNEVGRALNGARKYTNESVWGIYPTSDYVIKHGRTIAGPWISLDIASALTHIAFGKEIDSGLFSQEFGNLLVQQEKYQMNEGLFDSWIQEEREAENWSKSEIESIPSFYKPYKVGETEFLVREITSDCSAWLGAAEYLSAAIAHEKINVFGIKEGGIVWEKIPNFFFHEHVSFDPCNNRLSINFFFGPCDYSRVSLRDKMLAMGDKLEWHALRILAADILEIRSAASCNDAGHEDVGQGKLLLSGSKRPRPAIERSMRALNKLFPDCDYPSCVDTHLMKRLADVCGLSASDDSVRAALKELKRKVKPNRS